MTAPVPHSAAAAAQREHPQIFLETVAAMRSGQCMSGEVRAVSDHDGLGGPAEAVVCGTCPVDEGLGPVGWSREWPCPEAIAEDTKAGKL